MMQANISFHRCLQTITFINVISPVVKVFLWSLFIGCFSVVPRGKSTEICYSTMGEDLVVDVGRELLLEE